MITPEIIQQHGLTPDEYQRIVASIGREPNLTELGIFSVMWSEHCSYKSSRAFLSKLPTTGPRVIHGPGENAGIIDFTDDLALAFKMESHNHPSFIEPYQGAATGVGGILRDVFTMGARPIANLNALRFGHADHAKTAHLLRGVVAGIGGYGNCVGVPTVGGEIQFDACFNGNILVNAFTIGLVDKDKIFLGSARGVGNPVLYVGSKTGRDGIHGATMASASFGEGNEERRPTVQVGDPFTEKLLLEACIAAMHTGAILGIQDMGAAGLTSSAFEMASRAGNGLALNLDAVPQRESNMTAYDLMLSESQERMLMVVERGREPEVLAIFSKWNLDARVVGKVTDTGRVRGTMHGEVVIDLPVAPVVHEAPRYERPRARPAWQDAVQQLDLEKIPVPSDCSHVLQTLVASPNLCSRAWVWEQYDQQVGTNTVVLPGSDAAVLRVKNTERGVALAVDCNSRYCYLDPFWGAAHAVAEAARNVVCSGAVPQAATDCLNFGNPEDPAIMWQFEQAVLGIREACLALHTPIVSGNVSLYNATNDTAIYPTPMIGMVGILENISRHRRQGFPTAGLQVVLLGDVAGTLGGSEYLAVIHHRVAGKIPHLDLQRERGVQQLCLDAIARDLIASAHDVSDGGLAVALAECAMTSPKNLGATITLPVCNARRDEKLFGEGASRILVTCAASHLATLQTLAMTAHVPLHHIGVVGGEQLLIDDVIDISVSALQSAWNGTLRRIAKDV